MYDLIARPLQFFYELWPNYAGAISLLTLSIMLVLMPLTLKGTRSMLAMTKLQPELKKLQNKHRDDRQKLNEEVMKFYKENNINPMSGCLPLLLQMPVFFLLYRALYSLLNRVDYGRDMGAAVARSITGSQSGVYEGFGNFAPQHLDTSSRLYQDLSHTNKMESFGINLAESAQKAFSHGLGYALPFVALVLIVTATSYYQQRQIAGRNTGAQVNPQQQMLMKIMPLFFSFISFTLPAGIVVYFLVSNLFRIGQQGLITRTMYREEHDVIDTTASETDKKSKKAEPDAPAAGGLFAQIKALSLPSPQSAKEGFKKEEAPKSSSKGKTSSTAANKAAPAAKKKPSAPAAGEKPKAPSRTASGPSRSAPSGANRSRAKKKRK